MIPAGTAASIPADFIASLTTEQLLDVLAIQLDGPRAGDRHIVIHFRFTDTDEDHALTFKHGVLTHRRGAPAGPADATMITERSMLNDVIAGIATLEGVAASGRLTIEGDPNKLGEVLSLLDPPDPGFAIITP